MVSLEEQCKLRVSLLGFEPCYFEGSVLIFLTGSSLEEPHDTVAK